uniref:Putative secreted protein n=1 Tax=Amblyomma triste TaxID=251400 RepID=A0A023G1D8_AMBTT
MHVKTMHPSFSFTDAVVLLFNALVTCTIARCLFVRVSVYILYIMCLYVIRPACLTAVHSTIPSISRAVIRDSKTVKTLLPRQPCLGLFQAGKTLVTV